MEGVGAVYDMCSRVTRTWARSYSLLTCTLITPSHSPCPISEDASISHRTLWPTLETYDLANMGGGAGAAPAVTVLESLLPRLRHDGWQCLAVGADAGDAPGQARGARLLLTRISNTETPSTTPLPTSRA